MEKILEHKKQITVWIIGLVAACSLIYLGVENIGAVTKSVVWVLDLIMPIILGFGFAIVLDVPLKFFERHMFTKSKKPIVKKLRRPLAFIISLLVIIAVIVGVVMLVIPELTEAVKVISQIITDFVNKIMAMKEEDIAQLPFGEMILKVDWKKLLNTAQDWLKNKGGTIVNTAFTTIGSFIGGVVDIGIALVFAGYVVLNKDRLKRQFSRLVRAWLPKKLGERLIHCIMVANDNFRNFISGQTLEASILGILCMLGMFVLRIPYAPMVGALVGVTALIPVVGGFIGAGVGAVMILTQDPIKAVIFVVFLIILQQLEGDFIYPKVMGSRVNLPSMWILAAVAIGGSVAGPMGMLISVPIASTCYSLVKEFTQEREEKIMLREKQEDENKDDSSQQTDEEKDI